MMKPLACTMALTLFLQLIQSKIDLLIISDQLCFSALIFCTVSAIGISVKSHIGTSLMPRHFYLYTWKLYHTLTVCQPISSYFAHCVLIHE